MPGSSCDARRPSGDAAANSSPTLRPVASDDDRYGDCPIRRPSRRSTVEPSGASRAGTTSSSAARFARRRFGIGTWAQGGNAEPTNRTRAFESIRARPHRPRPQARHCCPVADQQYERDCWIGPTRQCPRLERQLLRLLDWNERVRLRRAPPRSRRHARCLSNAL